MMNIFTFPNIDEPRKTIAALLTPQPGWDENRIKKTMEVFHMEEKERRDDAGPRLVLRSDTRELEIFRTSDSIRSERHSDRPVAGGNQGQSDDDAPQADGGIQRLMHLCRPVAFGPRGGFVRAILREPHSVAARGGS